MVHCLILATRDLRNLCDVGLRVVHPFEFGVGTCGELSGRIGASSTVCLTFLHPDRSDQFLDQSLFFQQQSRATTEVGKGHLD